VEIQSDTWSKCVCTSPLHRGGYDITTSQHSLPGSLARLHASHHASLARRLESREAFLLSETMDFLYNTRSSSAKQGQKHFEQQ
jgi:hypothetical protein